MYTRRAVAGGLLAVALGATAAAAATRDEGHGTLAVRQIPAAVVPARPVPEATPAPPGLPKISYWNAAPGFPRDPAPHSLEAVTEGLRPHGKAALYDAPGGRARAFLPRSISGLPTTAPIVAREPGWLGVLVPSINRRIGWVPVSAGTVHPLRDQLVVDLSERRLTWRHNGKPRGDWEVAIGSSRTPTPLGRTYVMGRTITNGHVYAGLDALVLGAIPDDRDALSASLRNGHTAIHAWNDESAFGRSISNGCIRMPPDAQRTLLRHIPEGVVLTVVE
ncbi:L,D-transpeptidase [Actinoplanes sp. TRM 88003]|uniref:L,D-transpeptidase n=1 Tax=Paractinoplanes aksuensis TaxID=2939490 RepID=A0ABT1DZV8_9ACTN|nr:L,D-transpeptidase [Actinoplanes aksuensis]MCO8276394.1 L,D-transpeptidase [Actinoplanes aksuensis]